MEGSGPSPAERAEQRLGVVLRDRYRIDQVLGVGGMATVYQATHRNGHRVALKILRAELSVHQEHRRRFIREAYVANSIDHPGALRVLDDDVAEDGCPFLVMELLRGETLEARYRRLRKLPPGEVLTIAHALCDLLVRAHAAGVVHRDIKPDNIFLTERGEVRLLDFGIARARQEGASATRTGHLLGTPAYMPPEQAIGRRHEIDGRSDLWALGATMFALLAGRAVHQADAPEEMIVRSATLPAPALADIEPSVPAPIAALVDRALAFAPQGRFPDAAAMQAAIVEAHLAAFGTPLQPLQPPGPAPADAPPLSGGLATFAAETLASDPNRALTRADGPAPLASSASLDLDDPSPILGPAASASPPALPPPPPLSSPPSVRRRRLLGAGLSLLGLGGLGAWIFAAPSGACARNADCQREGAPRSICRKDQGRCVALETDRCRVLARDHELADDDTLWVGAMYPISDATTDYGLEASRCVELARDDFADVSGGLPPTRPGGRPRPIGVVLCDDTADHERIAAHLVDEVGVPAIMGFRASKEVLDLASAQFVPKGVLALASNTAAMLVDIPHPPGEPRLVYRVTTSATMSAPASVAFLRGVIGPATAPDEPLRIAIVRNSSATGASHTDAIFTALADTRPPGGREEVRPFLVADAPDHDPALYRKAAAEVAAFAPHFIVDGGAVVQTPLFIERAWQEGPRPRYIYGGLDDDVRAELVATWPDITARFVTIGVGLSRARSKFAAHHAEVFGASPSRLSPTPYDAFYTLAYAALALGDAPITGRALARAIPRLVPPGEPIEVGPAGIYPAAAALARGSNIDLQGTYTSLDFDPRTGDATAEFTAFCFGPRGDLVETDLRLGPRPPATIHAWPCPAR